jgi:uncharacterized protein YbjT (DUF2867 family)
MSWRGRMTTEMVLVTRATGNTGRPLVEMLSNRGVAVRAMVRSEAGREQLAGLAAEVVVADFDDPDAVSVALAGRPARLPGDPVDGAGAGPAGTVC